MFRAMNRIQWKAMLSRLIPAATKVRTKTGRTKRPFRFQIEGHVFTVQALTRSEARATLKHNLGLKRLPSGCSVRDASRKASAA